MKYLKRFKINEGWQNSLKGELSYDKEEEIRGYFIELFDIGWTELPIRHRICDDDFNLTDGRLTYNDKSLYPRYTFTFESNQISIKMNDILEIMNDITEILERLKYDGYVFIVEEMSVSPRQRLSISLYNTEDAITWELIFINKSER